MTNKTTLQITIFFFITSISLNCKNINDNTKTQKQFGIFEVQTDNLTVHMNGEIDSNIINSFKQLRSAFPDAKRIVMLNCPGSTDDWANLEVSKQMHNLGYHFHLTATSKIASGAVDMYVGGIKRTREIGSQIGVHSWGNDPGEPEATSYPPGHQVHLQYINYYVSVGFTQREAEEFYYFTINVAPAESIHWMTETEISQFKITRQ